MSELRPCPWNCKQAIEITRMIGSERYSLLHRCPVVGPISFTEETAEACSAAWNHRPVEDALVEIFQCLLGERGEFPDRDEDQGLFWWRNELRKRLSRRTMPPPAYSEKEIEEDASVTIAEYRDADGKWKPLNGVYANTDEVRFSRYVRTRRIEEGRNGNRG